MPHLVLTLFGSPQVHLDGIPLGIAAQKALALLVYLVLTGVPHRRDALATLFWPDYRQADARTYLRQALHELTKTMGPIWFEVNRENIGLSRALPIQSDVHEFRRLVRAGRNDPDALRQAVALYKDDFLAGFSLPDCPEFDQWQLLEAESLRRTMAEAIQELMRWHMAQQAYAEAIELAYRWLVLDPYHEPAHRSLMQLYAWTGQQAAALRQYEECRRLLREALASLPDPETQKLYEQIRSSQLPPPLAALPSAPLTQQVHSGEPQVAQPPTGAVPAFMSGQAAVVSTALPFVARERELGELARALATARLGTGQILFVIGGAGRGKTTLVQEFARRAQQSDPELLVASGMCDAYTGIGDPYLPFREILLALVGDVETKWAGGLTSTESARRLWEAMPFTLPALVEFAPDLIGALVPVKALQERAATFAPSEADWFQQMRAFTNGDPRIPLEERRLFTQFTEVLKAIAAQRPLLLILEDLHWVDAASNSLLFHLSRALGNSRILVVGTYRPDELIVTRKLERHPFAGIVGELKRQHGDIWLDLGTLSLGEGRAFVDAYLDMQPNRLDETFRAALFQHTEGHALFTAELLRDMRERGDLYRNTDGYWMTSETVVWSALPAKVEGVIEQRIGRLEEELQEILAVASIEGEVFTAEITARVQRLAEHELVQRLSRDLDRQHRLVRVESLDRAGEQRLSRYRFRHHLFQQYLYGRLTASERAYLHEEVGYAMEALYAGQIMPVAVQLAHHFEQAGLSEKAVVYLQQVGEHAHRLSANKEAAQHLSRALVLLTSLPTSRIRAQRELALRVTLGRVLVALKGIGSSEAGEMYARAYELCQQVGDSHDLFAVLHGLYSCAATYEPLRKIAEQMLDLAENDPSPIYRVSAHHLLGNTLMMMGELVLAQTHFERSLALYEPRHHLDFLLLCGQDEGIACMANQCMALWYLGYPDRALQRGQEAIALAEELFHPMSLSIALHFVANIHLLRGEVRAANRQIGAVLEVGSEQGFGFVLSIGTLYRGEALLQEGQFEAAIAQIEQAMKTLTAIGGQAAKVLCLLSLARAYGQIGLIERGLMYLNEAQTAIDTTAHHLSQARLHQIKGELLVAQAKGDMDSFTGPMIDAEASFLRAIETARQQQAKSLELRATIGLCRMWQAQGKVGEARSLLAEIYGWFTEGFDTVDLVEARRLLDTLTIVPSSVETTDSR